MLNAFAAAVLIQSLDCPAERPVDAPDPGTIFDYRSVSRGHQAFEVILRNEIVTARGTLSAFRQGAGLTVNAVEMPDSASVQGHFGILFPVVAGQRARRREWSYSPAPDTLLENLSEGEAETLYVSERHGGANERYALTIQFVGCEGHQVGEDVHLSRRYRLTSSPESPRAIDREVWILQDHAWWIREIDHLLDVETTLIAITAPQD